MAKFVFVKPVESSVATYGSKGATKVKTGDEVELDGFFAEKARANPDYEEVIKEDK